MESFCKNDPSAPRGTEHEAHSDSGFSGPAVAGPTIAGHPGTELAAWCLMARRLREEILGSELFSDPAWDILLDIYAAQARGKKIQISSLAPVNSVPSSTARRWAHKLIELGLLERERDERDRRLTYVRLSPCGRERILLFIERLLAKGPPPPLVPQ